MMNKEIEAKLLDYDKLRNHAKEQGTLAYETSTSFRVTIDVPFKDDDVPIDITVSLLQVGKKRLGWLSSPPASSVYGSFLKTVSDEVKFNEIALTKTLKPFCFREDANVIASMTFYCNGYQDGKKLKHEFKMEKKYIIFVSQDNLEHVYSDVYYLPDANLILESASRSNSEIEVKIGETGTTFIGHNVSDPNHFPIFRHEKPDPHYDFEQGVLLKEDDPLLKNANPRYRDRLIFREDDYSHLQKGIFVSRRGFGREYFEIIQRNGQFLTVKSSNGHQSSAPISTIDGVFKMEEIYTPFWSISKDLKVFGKVVGKFGGKLVLARPKYNRDECGYDWDKFYFDNDKVENLPIHDRIASEMLDDPKFIQLLAPLRDNFKLATLIYVLKTMMDETEWFKLYCRTISRKGYSEPTDQLIAQIIELKGEDDESDKA